MAALGELLTRKEDQIEEQRAEVKRLRNRYEEKLDALDRAQTHDERSRAESFCAARKELLQDAQEELTALEEGAKLYIGQLFSPESEAALAAPAKRHRPGHMYTRNSAAEDDPSLAERTFRVVEKASGKCCGIASSIGRGQVVTALHVVEGDDGVPIPVQAKGLDLTLVAKNEALDVAILQPAGEICTTPFCFSNSKMEPGTEIACLSFAQMQDAKLHGQGEEPDPLHVKSDSSVLPTITKGCLACKDGDYVAIGTYQGWPNSSGGPVVSPSDTLVGVHTQSFYHPQPIADDAFSDEQMDAMRQISADRTSKKEQKIQVQALAVMLANTDLNIDEKSCASTFVTARAIQAIRASIGLKDLPKIRPKKLTFLEKIIYPSLRPGKRRHLLTREDYERAALSRGVTR